jgi:ornithine decarboxylase
MDYRETSPVSGELVGVNQQPAFDSEILASSLPRFASIEDMVKALRPNEPVRCIHPDMIVQSAQEFLQGFPGLVFYALKANPNPHVIRRLWQAGVRRFDVASLNEIILIHGMFPDARMAFMHPCKNREAIARAYFEYGIRDFVTDSFEELYKILEETKTAADLSIHIRMGMPQDMSGHSLSKKFGASPEETVKLLQDSAKVANKIGLCFHVGHLCFDHTQYARAIGFAAEVIAQSGVELDVFDLGGGFARSFPGQEAPSLEDYFTTIRQELAKLRLPENCQVWGEPGLALTVDSESLVVRVELRKGNALYINEGTYGALFDAAGFRDQKRFPVQLIRVGKKCSSVMQSFELYGPTCDSIDHMPGPFMLPKDTREGDWIVIGRQGAYGYSMQTKFNGFYSDQQVEIDPKAPPLRRIRRSNRNSIKAIEATEQ